LLSLHPLLLFMLRLTPDPRRALSTRDRNLPSRLLLSNLLDVRPVPWSLQMRSYSFTAGHGFPLGSGSVTPQTEHLLAGIQQLVICAALLTGYRTPATRVHAVACMRITVDLIFVLLCHISKYMGSFSSSAPEPASSIISAAVLFPFLICYLLPSLEVHLRRIFSLL
jgi:hypothetical protein